MKIAFDVGGVLSKYPSLMRRLLFGLHANLLPYKYADTLEVHILTDQHNREKVLATLKANGFSFIPENRVHCSDYRTHGEACKAVLCRELGIDVLVDDFPGYVATPDAPPVRLLVMPDPGRPYFADDWQTDGSEGDFGRRHPGKDADQVIRRNPPGSQKPTEDR